MGWVSCGGAREHRELPERGTSAIPGADALDDALGLLQERERAGRQGLSSHASMAAEALCAMGFADRAVPWVEVQDSSPVELPVPRAPIDRGAWRAALGPRRDASTWEGQNPRFGDWREFFSGELEQSAWRDVLDTWVARLAPGLCGAATHGVIRTAHAARGLSQRESLERRGELARGLAYWASAYEELPVRGGSSEAKYSARVASYGLALERLPLYWEEFGRAPTGRNIVEGLRHVVELEGFADARDLVEPSTDVSAELSALSRTFAGVYLRHGTHHDAIAFVHAVTGPCALRRIAPHVRPETARATLPYAWQAAAAIYSTYGRRGDEPMEPEPKLARDELALRAVENGDAHAIKFTEVLLAEHALDPDPVYLAAAEDAVARL